MIDTITEISSLLEQMTVRSLASDNPCFSFQYNWGDFVFSFSFNDYDNRNKYRVLFKKKNPELSIRMKGINNFSREQLIEFINIVIKEDTEETITIDTTKELIPPQYSLHSVSRILPDLNTFESEHAYISVNLFWQSFEIKKKDGSFSITAECKNISLAQFRRLIALGAEYL